MHKLELKSKKKTIKILYHGQGYRKNKLCITKLYMARQIACTVTSVGAMCKQRDCHVHKIMWRRKSIKTPLGSTPKLIIFVSESN